MNIKIGEDILIRHEVDHYKDGTPFIVGSRMSHTSKVTYVYMNGRVQVSSGDVWSVKRLDNGKLTTTVINGV